MALALQLALEQNIGIRRQPVEMILPGGRGLVADAGKRGGPFQAAQLANDFTDGFDAHESSFNLTVLEFQALYLLG